MNDRKEEEAQKKNQNNLSDHQTSQSADPLLSHRFLNQDLERLRRELAEDEKKTDEKLRDLRAGRKKPEERIRIAGRLYKKEEIKKRLCYGALGAGIVVCAVVGVTALAKNVRFSIRGAQTPSNATLSTASAWTATVSAALSPEEEAASEKEAAISEELSQYQDLGIANTTGYINVRSRPDSIDMTNIIGKLSGGAACDIISTEGDWTLIRSGGLQGYVYSSYLTTGAEAQAIAASEMQERAVIQADVLNIRTEPEVDPENVVGKARKNERYRVVQVEGDWAEIRPDLIEGVDTAYINIADGNASVGLCLDAARKMDLREMALTQYDNLVVSNTNGYINIRETPDANGIDNICGKFPAHAGAELLETTEAGGRTWYKIKSGDVTGYVSAEYCATGQAAKDAALSGAVLTAFVRTDALNVRSEPSLSAGVWTQVTKDQAYHVLNQLDGWVEIELDSSDEGDESDRAFVSTRDNNVEVRYGLPEAVEYHPAVDAANAAMAFRNQIVNYACQFVGNPYVWGGTSLTKGADCSGFTMKVLEHFGISIPRVSRAQAKAGSKITSAQMKPGDLVFYANRSGVINHVGMYIGNGQVVNAASRRSGIRIYRWNYRTPVAIRNVIGA